MQSSIKKELRLLRYALYVGNELKEETVFPIYFLENDELLDLDGTSLKDIITLYNDNNDNPKILINYITPYNQRSLPETKKLLAEMQSIETSFKGISNSQISELLENEMAILKNPTLSLKKIQSLDYVISINDRMMLTYVDNTFRPIATLNGVYIESIKELPKIPAVTIQDSQELEVIKTFLEKVQQENKIFSQCINEFQQVMQKWLADNVSAVNNRLEELSSTKSSWTEMQKKCKTIQLRQEL
jgi:hypothetical protein